MYEKDDAKEKSMLDFREFLFIAMQSSLKRHIDEVDPPVSTQSGYKTLVIDKRPDRYVRRAMDRYSEYIRSEPRRSPRITQREAASKLVRWWSQTKFKLKLINNSEKPAQRGCIRTSEGNAICPITQDPIKTEESFHAVLDNGAVVVYTMEDLVRYLSSTGVFQCCLTRQPFHIPTIARLVKFANKAGIAEAGDLRSIYMEKERIRISRIEHDNRILAIEASCASVITEIFNAACNHDIGAVRAIHEMQELIPEWRQLVNDYIRLDARSCKIMLIGDRERIRRLKGTAYADPFEVLHQFDNSVIRERLELCDRQISRNTYYNSVFHGHIRTPSIPQGTGFFGQAPLRPAFMERPRNMTSGTRNDMATIDSITDIIVGSILNDTTRMNGFQFPAGFMRTNSGNMNGFQFPDRFMRTNSGNTQASGMSLDSDAVIDLVSDSEGTDMSDSSDSLDN